jgi:hypothetical protein
MSARTPVYVICSPFDRVGKTLVARLLAEFFTADDRYVEAFDLNADAPSLIDYLPGCTAAATIDDTPGQMALFDRLVTGDGAAKIVDLGHAVFERFFTVLAQVDFVSEAARRNVQIIVMFVASPEPASIKAYATLQRWLPGLTLVPIHNEALVRGPQRGRFPTGGAGLPLRLPLLAPTLARVVGAPEFSFAEFRAGKIPAEARPYRFELESWLRRAWVEFRELELRLLLASLRLRPAG